MSSNKRVVIFGTNDFAELSHYYISNDTNLKVDAFTVTKDYFSNPSFRPSSSQIDFPIVAFEDLEKIYPPSEFSLFAPMSGAKMNFYRKKIYEEGLRKGYSFISYVSSKATLFDNKIGDNCFILEDNTIQPFTEIGNNVVLWSGNHIGHHGKIEDHSFFTSHVVMSGHCHIKQRAWLGVNATIRDGVTIGEGCLVAMGSLITKSTEDHSFYMGSPAKKQLKTSEEAMK